MPFDLLDVLQLAADAPDFRKRRERIGCLLGLTIVSAVGLILFAISWI